MYFDDNGNSHTLEVKPYFDQAKSIGRIKRQKQNLEKLASKTNTKVADAGMTKKSATYKSPEHVRTEPDYSLAARPCKKRKKRQQVGIDECFSMFLSKNAKQHGLKKKRRKKQVSIAV